jgi:hypothetical protein
MSNYYTKPAARTQNGQTPKLDNFSMDEFRAMSEAEQDRVLDELLSLPPNNRIISKLKRAMTNPILRGGK